MASVPMASKCHLACPNGIEVIEVPDGQNWLVVPKHSKTTHIVSHLSEWGRVDHIIIWLKQPVYPDQGWPSPKLDGHPVALHATLQLYHHLGELPTCSPRPWCEKPWILLNSSS